MNAASGHGVRGDLVLLRAIESSDAKTLFRWINTPELVRHSAPFRPVHGPMHEAWLRQVATDNSVVAFAIEELATGRLVGTIQLVNVDAIHRNAEMRIRIGDAAARGRGLGRDALSALLRFAWGDLGLHRVHAYAFDVNESAIHMYEGVGFDREGVLRHAAFIEGAWHDLVLVAVLNPAISEQT